MPTLHPQSGQNLTSYRNPSAQSLQSKFQGPAHLPEEALWGDWSFLPLPYPPFLSHCWLLCLIQEQVSPWGQRELVRHKRSLCSSTGGNYTEAQALPSPDPHGVSVNSTNAGVHQVWSGRRPACIRKQQPASSLGQDPSLPTVGLRHGNRPCQVQRR